MADGNNIRCADIGKLEQFETDSKDAIAEFDRIKRRFKEINDALLSKWQGAGANQYKKGVIKSAKDAYLQLDSDLAAFNENPTTEEDGQG